MVGLSSTGTFRTAAASFALSTLAPPSFASGRLVDRQQRQPVGGSEAGCEIIEQLGDSIGRVRLEDRPQPPGVDLPRRRQGRSHRGRVMGVIVDDPDPILLPDRLEPSLGTFEIGQRGGRGPQGRAEQAGGRQRSGRVQGIVPAAKAAAKPSVLPSGERISRSQPPPSFGA